MDGRRVRSLAWLVFWLWAALSFSTIATTSDLWFHFKVGEDILAGLGFPSVERYSATAEGRPFVAYEWLSGVIFAWLHQVFGSPALFALKLAVGLACLLLLYFSLSRRAREHPVVLPLLMLATYLICFRSHLRPHLFSLLMISALCFALERWRRSRRLWDIAWLVPMHALWANLHGAYLFGVVVLAVMSGMVGLSAFLLGPWGDSRETYSRADLFQIGGVALAALLACALNPYGLASFELSLRISESSEFIKNSILEWQSPFQVGPGEFWFWVYCFELLVVSWVAVLQLRRRGWIDFVLAALVIFQTLRANRFIPYLAVFGFPIVVRYAASAATGWLPQNAARLRPGLDALLIAFMLVTSMGPASNYSPRLGLSLGWGFSPRMPFEEVTYIQERGLEGVVFNEYGDGAMIIYSLHPQVRPVMDPRIDVYGEELHREWREARSSVPAFFAYLSKYDAQLVLLHRAQHNSGVLQALRQHPDWRREHRFAERVLFARRRSSD